MRQASGKKRAAAPIVVPQRQARALWIAAQGLDRVAPFGTGPEAVAAAIAQLGYVQIDTINVIERSHHHILYTRIRPIAVPISMRPSRSTRRFSNTGRTP